MFHFTGDTHGSEDRFLLLASQGEKNWTEDDYLMISGDFGYLFLNNKRENVFLDMLEKKPYTICFCDGNHENFPAIYSYPEEIWNGGKIHRIRKNVIHLMRGQVYTIAGKTIFTMGGAYSIDKFMRIEGRSWWKEELPNNDEYREATRNLEACGYKVDYILTHTMPTQMITSRLFKIPDPHDAELTGFLDWINETVEYEMWFCGHWHEDRPISDKIRALYYDVVEIQ
ncbi:MAG: metallophosphoesterase [Clostridia bacterium]|nr:metallophosphoesterase [Clostridia bacterium]